MVGKLVTIRDFKRITKKRFAVPPILDLRFAEHRTRQARGDGCGHGDFAVQNFAEASRQHDA
jgi:hypothetical protein